VQPLCDRGIEDVAGLLERTERIGIHHLRPHVAVVAGRIVIAREDMPELRRPVPHRNLRGHADFSSSARSNAPTSRLAEAGWVWNSRSSSAEEMNSTVAKPWLNFLAARKRLRRSSGSGSAVW